ncbi:retinol dehydrogenase [Acrasis kona]|uniref:Retinol dehydrogenase n=1 Tax=Acrasis kona TaxID=1008807 RepID=A0AAW2YNL6_9EUKA
MFDKTTTAEQVLDAYSNLSRHKTVLITGCNCGIGYETAKQFYRGGACVIMLCRSEDKMLAAKDNIISEVSNENNSCGTIECMKLDVSSNKSVKNLVEQWSTRSDTSIDTLILNAGVSCIPLSYTEDGQESTFATNHLGHFALALLLLPFMKTKATHGVESRIITISSSAHKTGEIAFDDFNWKSRWYGIGNRAYNDSKLANILFTRELHRRLKRCGKSEDIVAVSLDPGFIYTEIGRHSLMIKLYSFFAYNKYVPITIGAATTMYCALCPEIKGGLYFKDCAEETPYEKVLNDKVECELFDVSELITGVKFPFSEQ